MTDNKADDLQRQVAQTSSAPTDASNQDDAAVPFDPLAGLPSSSEGRSIASLLPAVFSLGSSTGSSSLDEQIQAFTAGLVNSFSGDASSIQPETADTSLVTSTSPTPADIGNTSNHDSAAAVESLLASLTQYQPSELPVSSDQNHAVIDQQHIDFLAQLSQQATPTLTPGTYAASTSPNYIDSLLEEASRNAFAAASSSTPPFNADPAQVLPASAPADTDATIAASLEEFMASLQARVTSSLTTEGEGASDPTSPSFEAKNKSKNKAVKPPKGIKPPKKTLGKRKYREIGPMERKMRVERAISEYIKGIDPMIKPNLVTGPLMPADSALTKMTTIRCTHASVAQKSYGSEKRFLNPPPVIHVTGPLRRYADWGPAVVTPSPNGAAEPADESNECNVSMLVKGEAGEVFSNEQTAALDTALEGQVKNLYVTPTGRSKSLRLQLSMLRLKAPDPATLVRPIKRPKLVEAHPGAEPDGTPTANGTDGPSAAPSPKTPAESLIKLPESLTWASFESAPVKVISKSTKKTVKPRSPASQVANGSLISLFNRINSQTVRTKYVRAAKDGRLTAQGQEWTAFKVTLISRPPQADLAGAGAEEGSITYGSTIVLTDVSTGASTDPLVVCKVDKGQVLLPQVDPPSEILMPGTGYRSRRIPVDINFRKGAGNDSGPISMMASTQKPSPVKPENGSGQTNGKIPGEDANVYGPVGQLQKVALMRFVPRSESDTIYGDSEHLESDFTPPRSYLCASAPEKWKVNVAADQVGKEPLITSYANTHASGSGSETLSDDVEATDRHKSSEGHSLTFVTPNTLVVPKEHGLGTKVVDEVDDTFVWTVIGISRFEFSFFDTSATEASKDEGPCEVSIAPFPLIASMPLYDQQNHTLTTTVTNFIVSAAITFEKVPLDVWIGPLGSLECQHQPRAPGSPETLITVKLPSISSMLDSARGQPSDESVPPHFLLPLLFVNDSDGTAFHSGRHVVCEDLVSLMQAAGHEASAETLVQLGFGLGSIAGPPKGGAWSLRII